MILMVNRADNQVMRYWACVCINNNPITMLVDTGSPISIIPEEVAEKVFNPEKDKWECQKSSINQKLKGNPVEQAGVLQTDVQLNSWKVQKARLLITPKERNNTPLLGADLIRRLGLRLTQTVDESITPKAGQNSISNINTDLKTKMQSKFKSLFTRQGKIKNHVVRTKFKKPLQATQQKGRRIPIALQEKVADEITRLMKEGHIKKLKSCNEDQFISPIVITVKKDGSLKLALDSKKLNEWVIKNKNQMPNIDELIDQIAQIITSNKPGRVWFTTVDLAYAYGQLALVLETARQCNFSIVGGTATGTYQLQTGFYGLADMPAEFQQAMDRTLGNHPGVFAFIDDVLMMYEEHENLVQKTLKRIDQNGMALKLKM